MPKPFQVPKSDNPDFLKCSQCFHEWRPESTDYSPGICPSCKSPYWNEEKKRGPRPRVSKTFFAELTDLDHEAVARRFEITEEQARTVVSLAGEPPFPTSARDMVILLHSAVPYILPKEVSVGIGIGVDRVSSLFRESGIVTYGGDCMACGKDMPYGEPIVVESKLIYCSEECGGVSDSCVQCKSRMDPSVYPEWPGRTKYFKRYCCNKCRYDATGHRHP